MRNTFKDIKTANMFLSLFIDLIIKKNKLNESFENNYEVCKKISNRLIDKSKVPFEVNGSENLNYDEPLLVCSNHKSFFDIFTLIAAIDKPMPFAAAKELISYPLLRDYINSINCVIVDREATDFKIIKEQLKFFENAITSTGLILFPEGECSYDSDEIKEFKKGGFMSVLKNDTRIVPCHINYEEMNRIGKWMIPTGKINVEFGDSFIAREALSDIVRPHEIADYTRKKVLELKKH